MNSDISLEQLIAELDAEPVSDMPEPFREPQSPITDRSTADRHKPYITFFLDEIFLAAPLSYASEIGRDPAITPLPNLPEWVLGLSNIRGEIISIVDLKSFMGLPAHGFKKIRRFIVIHDRHIKVGIVVDRIAGIFSVSDKEKKKRSHDSGEISGFISAVVPPGPEPANVSGRGRLLNILDMEKLLSRINRI
ncbi:MAG: hypothetical protein BWK80_16985 [Desulfobacteraceae bacterium IS3]|nr:MAG: hypothetical protein BWK80_16985 [Desulfobacteraceae bacterium IS3]